MTERLVGDVIDRTLSTWLMGFYSAQYNALAIAALSTDAEFTCTLALGEIGTGSLIAIEDELAYVSERDATNNRLVVVRGVHGTTAAAHPVGTAIEVNPRFPRYAIRDMFVKEIDGWHGQLYQAKTFTASVVTSGGTIPVPATIDNAIVNGVVRVRRASLSILDGRFRRTNGYEVQGDFNGDGGTIALKEDVGIATTFQVTCACGYDTDQIADFGDDTDLVGDIGLTPGMCEILELGAAYRLLIGRGSVRLFPEAEGQSRLAAEVGARDIPAFAAAIRQLRDAAIADQVEQLAKTYGFSTS